MANRNTIQKELVRNAVMSMRRHVTADEVYEYIRKDYSTISKGTVYRNLGILAEEGKVRKIEVPNAPDRYDFHLENHYHVRCIKCGEVYDVALTEFEDLKNHIQNGNGMLFLDYDIFFKGICSKCQESGGN